ncbi:MAG TPA: DUF11 domain-containing protein [Candidatus Polarisedimenticolia bacterium]|nr:DUF11 domain-containing protein [Candidatus Polarisedimenticolia bacterium]
MDSTGRTGRSRRPLPARAAALALALVAGMLSGHGALAGGRDGSSGDTGDGSAGATCDPAAARAEDAAYELAWDGPGVWVGLNGAQRLRVVASEAGVLMRSPDGEAGGAWSFGLSLEGAGPATPLVTGRRIDLAHAGAAEWYFNGRKGLQHGLDVENAPGSGGRIGFRLTGSLTAKVRDDGRGIMFVDPRGIPVLAYADLHAVDADGRDVDVRWEREAAGAGGGTVLTLTLAAEGRRGPIRVRGILKRGKTSGVSASEIGPGVDAAFDPSLPRLLLAPANDQCAGAEVIPAAGPFPVTSAAYDITSATTVGDPPANTCQPDVSHSIWFRFTPAATGYYSFSLCADAPSLTNVPDTVLALYQSTSACAGLTQVAGGCDDDSCSTGDLQSIVTGHQLVAGQTYYAVAWQFGSAVPAPGEETIQLVVTHDGAPPAAPPNDQCGGAEMIPPAGPFPYLTALTADISSATALGDPAGPSCQPDVSRSVWYSFTPAVSSAYSFSLCSDGPTGTTVDDTVMVLYSSTGTCSGLAEMPGGCADDTCTLALGQSSISGATLTAGTTYYVVAWKFDLPAPLAGHTAVQMRVTQVLGPANDTCAGAVTLSLNSPIAGTTAAATDNYELSGSACFTGVGQTPVSATGSDVVYRFTAPDAGAYSFRVSPADATKNVVLDVASDCPAGPFPATITGCLGAANRSTGNPAEEVACLPLAAGQAVNVFVDEIAASMGTAFILEATPCTKETEPDSSPANAMPPACGLEGSIVPNGDADYFALGSPASGSRVFALVDSAAANNLDLDLRVTTAVDTLEYDDTNNDAPFGATSANLAGTPLTGVAAFAQVTHFSINQQAEPYRLYTFVEPPTGSAFTEVEPNNSTASASGGAALYFSGALSSTTDVDHFAFTAQAGDLIQIGLDLDPLRNNTPWNGILALLDASGAVLLSVNDSGSTSSTTAGTGSLVAKNPSSPAEGLVWRARAAGTYYARVSYSSGTAGDYLVGIGLNCRIGPAGDLRVTQSDAPDPVQPGANVTYTVQVSNLGATTATGVSLRDDLPAGAGFVSATPSQGTCGGATCALGSLAGGASATVSVVVTAPANPGTMVNKATVTAATIDSNPANDTALASTTVGAPDGDGDGVPDATDCAPGDPTEWAVPGEATGLVFPTPGNTAALQWNTPAAPGGTLVRYDLLRSTSPNDYSAAACAASGITATTASDVTAPVSGLYYLVRSRNTCGANLGAASNGTPRTGVACP